MAAEILQRAGFHIKRYGKSGYEGACESGDDIADLQECLCGECDKTKRDYNAKGNLGRGRLTDDRAEATVRDGNIEGQQSDKKLSQDNGGSKGNKQQQVAWFCGGGFRGGLLRAWCGSKLLSDEYACETRCDECQPEERFIP